jgi:S-adenosylmethionine synthetase
MLLKLLPVKKKSENEFLWTSECVGAGHPDKVADQISDSILDACLEQDPLSRVACETLVKNETVILAGEITTKAYLSLHTIVENTLKRIGYEYEPKIINLLTAQSLEISDAVGDQEGAGDQGIMFGYATSETPETMPITIALSRELIKMLEFYRTKCSNEPWLKVENSLLPDCKTQVTMSYHENGEPNFIDRVVISVNHKPGLTLVELQKGVRSMIDRWFGIQGNCNHYQKFFTEETIFDINPAGLWCVLGGPAADCGLTGRKIIVDGYGADCQWGGGALSGKDPTKVDRSAAYMARYIAKNIVKANLAKVAKVQLSYVIGRKNPSSFRIQTNNGKTFDHALEDSINKTLSLRPKDIIKYFDLCKPIYSVTASKGHFGIEPYTENNITYFPWEQTNLFT